MMTKEKLLKLLLNYDIPLDKWGVNEAKTFDHLLIEIQSGEATLKQKNDRIVRSAQGSIVMVYYIDKETTWELREDRQVFKDGRVRHRTLESSIGEKMKIGESSIDAAYRALKEELCINEKLPLIQKPTIIKDPVESQSYPGIITQYMMYSFEVFLPRYLYNPSGYTEHQDDKSSYFIWNKS